MLNLKTYPCSAWPELSGVWSELAEASDRCSFFLTTPWIETWIETFGPRLDLSIAVFESDGRPVGICLLVKSPLVAPFKFLRRISLNASGEPAADTTYLEFNEILCRPGWEVPVTQALCSRIAKMTWDEFALDGFCPGPAYDTLKAGLSTLGCEEVRHPSYYVDLAALRQNQASYVSALGSTTRKHLRQNIRYHSEIGELKLHVAGSVPSALGMLNELADLSQQRSAAQGKRGIFSSTRFRAFHCKLIERCFAEGAVQLLRVTAGEQTVGVLYHLVHRSKVYFYQCGYFYGDDKRLSPGTVTLSLAIQHCLDAGLDDYDFLSGEAKYKEQLSTGSRNLMWSVFRRPSLKLNLLNELRRVKRRSIGAIE